MFTLSYCCISTEKHFYSNILTPNRKCVNATQMDSIFNFFIFSFCTCLYNYQVLKTKSDYTLCYKEFIYSLNVRCFGHHKKLLDKKLMTRRKLDDNQPFTTFFILQIIKYDVFTSNSLTYKKLLVLSKNVYNKI